MEQRIKNRISYQKYKKLGQEFIKIGVPLNIVGDAITKTHEFVDKINGYGSASASKYAAESIEFLKKEFEVEDKRKCNQCQKEMTEGYCINGGEEYYCTDACLHKKYSKKEWAKMYDNGNSDSYWTQWDN